MRDGYVTCLWSKVLLKREVVAMKSRILDNRDPILWSIGGIAMALLLGAIFLNVTHAAGAKSGANQKDIDRRIQELKNLGATDIDPTQLEDEASDPNMVPETTEDAPAPPQHVDLYTDSDSE